MACSLNSSSSSDNSDELMIDPTLDYINEILMDEGMDDAAYLQQANGTSNYQAIFSSLQDMIGDNSAVTNHGDLCDPYQSLYCLHQKGPDKYHAVPHYGFIDALHLTAGPVPRIRGQSVAKDWVPTDATTSCWGKNGFPEGPRGHVHQEHYGNGVIKSKLLHSADDRVSSNLVSELKLSFEELNVGDMYASLYVEEPSSSTTAARSNGRLDADKKKSISRKGSVWEKKRRSDRLGPDVSVVVDVKEVLVSCAQAVATGDVTRANTILKDMHKVYGASAHGTALQRIAYIFGKALVARMNGRGAQEFKAMSFETSSSAAVLRASKLDFKVSPFRKIQHYFTNQSILKVAEGASRLHIVDFGLMYGLQWACLIHALADRKGGPPLLVITGVEYPDLGFDVAERLVESGQRLAAYANAHNVPFQYHALVTDKWEELDAASLQCSEAEVLVVNFLMRLRNVPDDNVDSPSTISTRQKLLTFVHSLNPHLLVTMTLNAAHNLSFFVSRFREALFFYASVFEMLDTLCSDIPGWVIIERPYSYSSIINIVACEGVERVQRPETYKHWHACITKAGFLQVPLPAKVSARSESLMKQHYHKDFLIQTDEKGWMLMGWKGRIMFALSAWRPCHP